MKCRKFEKWISDGMDGSLSVRKRDKLSSHVETCPSCRAYGIRLKKIQIEAKSLPGPTLSPAYWRDSIARLESNLAKSGTAVQTEFQLRARRSPLFFPGRRWAWAGAASVLALGLGFYLMLFQGRGPLETSPLAFGDQINRLYEKIDDNAELETEFNSMIHASILEEAGESDGEIRYLLYGNSHFLDSLSDEEILILDGEISKALNI